MSSLTAAAIPGNPLVNLCPFHWPHLGRLSQENPGDPGNHYPPPYLPGRGCLLLPGNHVPLLIPLHSFPPHRRTVADQICEQGWVEGRSQLHCIFIAGPVSVGFCCNFVIFSEISLGMNLAKAVPSINMSSARF